MAYTDSDANFDVIIRGLSMYTTDTGGAKRPAVIIDMGGALARALYENRSGLNVGNLGPSLPSVNLGPQATGLIMWHIPGFTSHSMKINLDYESIDPIYDNEPVRNIIVSDPAYDSGVPTKPIPILEEWCLALGGSYEDLLMTA